MIPTRTTAFKIAICIIDCLASYLPTHYLAHHLITNLSTAYTILVAYQLIYPPINLHPLTCLPVHKPTYLLIAHIPTYRPTYSSIDFLLVHFQFTSFLFALIFSICSLLFASSFFFSAEHWSKAGACGAPVFCVSSATLCWPLSFLVFFCVFHSALISFCVWAVFSVVPELDGGLFGVGVMCCLLVSLAIGYTSQQGPAVNSPTPSVSSLLWVRRRRR